MIEQAAIFATSRQPAVPLGFYKVDCMKNISYMKSVMNSINIILDKASNVNVVPIDILVDAGMSNIAQLSKIQAT